MDGAHGGPGKGADGSGGRDRDGGRSTGPGGGCACSRCTSTAAQGIGDRRAVGAGTRRTICPGLGSSNRPGANADAAGGGPETTSVVHHASRGDRGCSGSGQETIDEHPEAVQIHLYASVDGAVGEEQISGQGIDARRGSDTEDRGGTIECDRSVRTIPVNAVILLGEDVPLVGQIGGGDDGSGRAGDIDLRQR